MNTIRKRTLEVTIISGENLCIDRTLVTEEMYVVVRPESIKCWSTKKAKQEGGNLGLGFTSWNEKLMVEMPLHAKSITIEVQCKTSKGVVRSIGIARIAIWNLIPKEEVCSEVLSYWLRNWEGRRSGVINFTVKLKEEEKQEDGDSMCSEMKGMIMEKSGDSKPEIIGASLDHHHQHMNVQNNGVVLGIPVWWNHPGIHV